MPTTVLDNQILIAFVQVVAILGPLIFQHMKLKMAVKEARAELGENTKLTEETKVSVNGRVEALIAEKLAAIEESYRAKMEALDVKVKLLESLIEKPASGTE